MKKFKSKIDIWLVVFIGAIFTPIMVITLYDKKWVGLILMFCVIAFIVHMFMTTVYIIENKKLTIKCGLFYNLVVEIQTIKKFSETSDIMSSPALSFDRLEILYNKFDTVLISPKEKSRFIEEIQKINSTIEVKYKI